MEGFWKSPTAASLLVILLGHIVTSQDLIPPPSQVNVFVSVVMLAGKPVLWANWTSPQSRLPILQYEVQYRFAVVRSFQNNNWIPAPNVTGSPPPTSIHLKGLTPGHSYLVRVRAVSASGSARRWSSFNISGIRIPHLPSQVNAFLFTAMKEEKSALWVNWTAPQSELPILQYEVQYIKVRSRASAWVSALRITGSPPQTSTYLKGLFTDTSYLVRVRAASAVGYGNWSSINGSEIYLGALCSAEEDVWSIQWPSTFSVFTQSALCQGRRNTTILGLAYRTCRAGGVWSSVDASECESAAIGEVRKKSEMFVNSLRRTNSTKRTLSESERIEIRNISSSLNTALKPSTRGDRPIPPKDLRTTAAFVETLANLGENNDLFEAENNETKEVVADILSNVLDESNTPAFSATETSPGADPLVDEASSPAVSILQSTERVATVFVNTLSQNMSSVTISRPNLALHGKRLSYRRLVHRGGFLYPGPGVKHTNFKRKESIPQIRFPPAFLFAARGTMQSANTIGSETIEVVNVVMNNMENYLPRAAVQQAYANETQAASLVFSSQIPGYDGGEVNTTETVEITFPLIEQATNLMVPPGRRKQFRCAFFNFTGGANRTGGWSYSGVQTEVINETHVRCNATHLTSFVVLVSIVPSDSNDFREPPTPLDYITYIGCSISFLCLLACIVFFLALRKELITKLHNFVHLNLCIALALGLLLFLTGIQTATANIYACKVVTAFLHYFFLATFTWTLCEAVLIYILLVKVFGANDKKWIYLYLALGWVLPIPIVVITGGVRHKDYLIRYSYDESHHHYDQFKACWLPTKHGTIFAFIGPMLAIIVINAVLLTISLGSLAKSQLGRTSEIKSEMNERRKEFLELGKRLFKATVILVPVMGFTWIIGLFAVGEEGKVFAYLFVIANVFQGLFIFLFHVVRHEKVYGKIKHRLPQCKKQVPTSAGAASATTGSTPIHSAKVKWADISKNGISFVSESETIVQLGSRNGEDTGSIQESDLEMKHDNVDEHAS